MVLGTEKHGVSREVELMMELGIGLLCSIACHTHLFPKSQYLKIVMP